MRSIIRLSTFAAILLCALSAQTGCRSTSSKRSGANKVESISAATPKSNALAGGVVPASFSTAVSSSDCTH